VTGCDRRKGAVVLACLFGIVLALRASGASADPPSAEASLSYERLKGAEVCPDETSLREQIELRLGYDPFRDGAPHRVSVRIAPIGHGFHARIQTSGPDGGSAEREIDGEGAGCDELLQSVVLAVSLAIDPMSFTRPPSAAPPQASPLPPPPPPTPVPASERALVPVTPAVAAPSPWIVQIDATARLGFGLVPKPSIGPAVDLRVGQKRWALVAVAGADLPTASQFLSGSSGPGVDASLVRGGLGACGLLGWFSACGRFDLGALEGSGTGMRIATSDTTFYADAALGAGLDVPVASGIHAVAGGELVAPLTRTPLKIESATPWTTPALAGSVGLGVGYRF
jgi:hypothetical protein